MAEKILHAALRQEKGKSPVRRLRRQGQIPCVLYGVDKGSVALMVEKNELEKLLSESHAVIRLKIDDEEERSVVKEIQYHPLKGDIIHLDLQRVKAGQEIHLTVPIKFIGSAPGVKSGGVFQTIRNELDISTLPKYIPNEIEIDISHMELWDTIHIKDLKLEHIKIHHEPDSSICSIVLPKVVEEPVAAEEELEEGLIEEEEEKEPEVITARSKDEEESKGEEG
jgi:large subunit ribosomal protein L25